MITTFPLLDAATLGIKMNKLIEGLKGFFYFPLHRILYLYVLDNLGDSTLEVFAGDVGYQGVHLFFGFLIFVPLAGEPYTDSVGNAPNAL